jgi:DNA-binding NarL/FixJ family response regulator
MNGNIRALICDDHTLFREGLKALLQNEAGVEVVGEAENGREAIEKLKQIPTDVVLMDISMPILNGFEATQRIVQTHRNIHVLILTMYDEDDLIIRALEAGASATFERCLQTTGVCDARSAKRRKVFQPWCGEQGCQPVSPDIGPAKRTYDLLSSREREVAQDAAEGAFSEAGNRPAKLSVKTVEAHK